MELVLITCECRWMLTPCVNPDGDVMCPNCGAPLKFLPATEDPEAPREFTFGTIRWGRIEGRPVTRGDAADATAHKLH